MLGFCCDEHRKRGRRDVEVIQTDSDSESNGDSTDAQKFSEDFENREWDSMFFPQFACSLCGAEGVGDVSAASAEVPMSTSFRLEAGYMPAAERPDTDKNIIINNKSVPGLRLEKLRDVIEDDSILMGYLSRFSQASDIDMSSWCDGAGRTRTRRAKFTMPVPQEVPAALASMLSIPEESRATLLLGYVSPSADELLVQLQQCTHDVPYGENFRVHEAMSFRRAPGGGVTFSKWTWIRWIKDLPWMVGAMKPITESKTKAGSPAGGEAFLGMLLEAAGEQLPHRRMSSLRELQL